MDGWMIGQTLCCFAVTAFLTSLQVFSFVGDNLAYLYRDEGHQGEMSLRQTTAFITMKLYHINLGLVSVWFCLVNCFSPTLGMHITSQH